MTKMKFKTQPNLGTRPIIVPVLGEIEVVNGIVELTQEEWKSIAKIDFGIKLTPLDKMGKDEDEIDKTEKSDPLQKPVPSELLKKEPVKEPEPPKEPETEKETNTLGNEGMVPPGVGVDEKQPENVSSPNADVSEGDPDEKQPDAKELNLETLMLLKRDELKEFATSINEQLALGKEKEITNWKKEDLAKFILEHK